MIQKIVGGVLKVINMLRKIWKFTLKFQKLIMIIASFLIIIGIASTVLLRYIFKMDLFGIEELIIIPSIWLYFMCASYASYEKSHISADIISSYVKNEKILLGFNIVKGILSFIIVTIVSYWSLQFLIWGVESEGKTPVWNVPMYVSILAVFIGFLLMFIYSTFHLVEDTKMFINKKKIRKG